MHPDPPMPLLPNLTGLIFAVACALFFWPPIVKRYIIFRASGDVATSSSIGTATGRSINASGEFILARKHSQKFVFIPSIITESPAGNFTVICNVDASRRFYGVVTSQQDGIWELSVIRNAPFKFVHGVQYFGAAANPAMKLDYICPFTGKSKTAYLCFQSEIDLAAALNDLQSSSLPTTFAPLVPIPIEMDIPDNKGSES